MTPSPPRNHRLRRWALAGCAAGAAALPAAAEDGPLDERLRAQEARLGELRRELEAVEVSLASRPRAGGPGPLGDLEIHGAVGQGFVWCDADHDYLTLETSRGSFALTDMTLNITKYLADDLRLGIQLFNRNFGELGEHRFQLDYAYFDYRCRAWLGLRAGRSKTRFGLYNDTQDQEALHPWVLPPFGGYDPTIRDIVLNHDGVDLYGRLDLAGAGTLSWTAALGTVLGVAGEGIDYYQRFEGVELKELDIDYIAVADLRWIGAGWCDGLTLGASYLQAEYEVVTVRYQQLPFGPVVVPPALITPFEIIQSSYEPMQYYKYYLEYDRDDLLLAAEVRLTDEHRERDFRIPGLPRILQQFETKGRGYYVLAGWRWSALGAPWLQTSVSWSDHLFDRDIGYTAGNNYLRDLAFTARLDLTEHWYLKAEVHDLHGWGWFTFIKPQLEEGHKSEHWFLFALKTGVVF